MASMRLPAAVVCTLAAVLALVAWRLAGPSPLPADAPAAAFSATRAYATFRATVGGERPHPVGTPEHEAVRDRIASHLRTLGYDVRIERRFACNAQGVCADTSNILATAAHAQAAPAVYLVAHYDSVGAGPGAADDGAGVATLLEIARAIRGEQLRNPVVFLIDDAEEVGLLGAEAFVSPQRGRLPVGAIVNLEARGTSGPSYLFETSRNNERLVNVVARALPRPATSSLFATIYDMLPNDTDLTVFKRNHYSGVNFAFLRDVTFYHTPLDDAAHLSLRTLQHHGENVLATTRALAGATLPLDSGGNAVWFDVLSFFVVSWRAGGTVAIALIVLVASIAGSGLLIGRKEATAGGIALELALALVALAVAVVLQVAVTMLLYRGRAQWGAYPFASIAAAWSIGVTLAMTWRARRSAPQSAFAATALLFALCGVVTAIALPGASYLFVVPAGVLAVATLVIATSRAGQAGVGVIASAAIAIIYFPLAIQIYWALGTDALPGVALLVLLVLLPAVAVARVPRRAIAAATLILVVFAAAGAVMPSITPRRPERNSLAYLDDGVSARWVTGNASGLRKGAQFSSARTNVYPWRRNGAFAAPAAPLGLPQPEVTRSVAGGVETYSLRSRRGAQRLALYFRTGSPPRAMKVNNTIPPPPPGRFRPYVEPPWHAVVAYSSALDVEIGAAPGDVIEAYAADYSYGLPSSAAALVAARSASHQVPTHEGDLTIVMRKVR